MAEKVPDGSATEEPENTRLAGGDLFGTPDSPVRYQCETHGVVLALDVLWRRDDKPYCPTCGAPLTVIIDKI